MLLTKHLSFSLTAAPEAVANVKGRLYFSFSIVSRRCENKYLLFNEWARIIYLTSVSLFMWA